MTVGGMRGRVLRAIGAGLIGQVLNIGGRLLLVPLFLTSWGAQAYGEWLIMSSAATWLAVADLGGQVYFVNRLTAEWARDAHDEFERSLATGFLFYLLVPGGLLLLFALISLIWPLAGWLGLVTTTRDVVTSVLLLLAFQVAVSLPQGLLIGIYRAIGAQATSTMLGNAIFVSQIAASCMVLLSGGGMVAMAMAQVAANACGLGLGGRRPQSASAWGSAVRAFAGQPGRRTSGVPAQPEFLRHPTRVRTDDFKAVC